MLISALFIIVVNSGVRSVGGQGRQMSPRLKFQRNEEKRRKNKWKRREKRKLMEIEDNLMKLIELIINFNIFHKNFII